MFELPGKLGGEPPTVFSTPWHYSRLCTIYYAKKQSKLFSS